MVTTTIPISRKTLPKSVNSKKLKRSAPRFCETELTIKLVDVPMRVQLPPMIPAKEIGSSSFDFEILKRLDSSSMILIKTITTAVVLINAEIPAVININIGSRMSNGSTWRFLSILARAAITPVSSMPIAMIIRESTVMVAVFENPAMASSGLTRPNSARDTTIKIAILSTGKTSKANRSMVLRRMAKTSRISRVIGPFWSVP